MYKLDIVLINGCTIIATSDITGIFTVASEMEKNQEFVKIGDVIIRKEDVLYVKEVKDDE